MKKYLMLFLGLGILATGCNKNDDDSGPDVASNLVVQNFMWQAMNQWYFWQEEVPNLSDDRFATTADYEAFLATESDPEDFFDNLRFSEDRFSFLNNDYRELVQNFAGVSKSNGLEFGLVRFADSDDVFGYVRYVIPNSDAATKTIQRGDLFTGVDGQTLTVNNFGDLLFGNNDSYTLDMADIANNTITPNGIEVTLTKMEGLTENPVFLDKTFNINGQIIGYLVYNSFTNEFDEDLNDAFGRFNAAGVTDLVLDMRYNPGGSVNSSRLISSMIYGTNTNDLYLRQRWNSKIQGQLSSSQLEDFFAATTGAGSPINSLDLSRVYILATNSSASASELVMNGLAPYVNVIHIGETTRGKNEFSITMVDDEANDYIYNSNREGNINSENSWAIQPLVGRNENANGFFDYTDGLAPDIELAEDFGNLSELGNENEPLLARAIQEITGVTAKTTFNAQIMPGKVMTNSKMFTLMKDNMYLDKPLSIKLQ